MLHRESQTTEAQTCFAVPEATLQQGAIEIVRIFFGLSPCVGRSGLRRTKGLPTKVWASGIPSYDCALS